MAESVLVEPATFRGLCAAWPQLVTDALGASRTKELELKAFDVSGRLTVREPFDTTPEERQKIEALLPRALDGIAIRKVVWLRRTKW